MYRPDTDVLACLFKSAPPDSLIEIRRLPSGAHSWLPLDAIESLEINDQQGWFFGVNPRGLSHDVVGATMLWVDIDQPPEDFDPTQVYPKPTMIMSSGGGYHMYWALTEMIEIKDAFAMGQLLRIVYSGDPKVYTTTRVMRIPGSTNLDPGHPKTVPATPVKTRVLHFEDTVAYSTAAAEDGVAAAFIAPTLVEGQRHDIYFALGALLAMANWPDERAGQLVDELCRRTADSERGNRRAAVFDSINRFKQGVAVSPHALREAVGKKEYRWLTEMLGVNAHDGDYVSADGDVVAHANNPEVELANYLADLDLLRFAGGNYHTYRDGLWERLPVPESVTAILNQHLNSLRLIMGGAQVPPQLTVKAASGVVSLAKGKAAGIPLDPMDPHLLPLENGILDLRDRTITGYEKDHRARWKCPTEYIDGAAAPIWERFIQEAVPDQADRDHLQRWLGYLLMRDNPHQRLLWLYGKSGTGKSTVLTTMANLLGPHEIVPFNANELNEYTFAALDGARGALCTELSHVTLKTQALKELAASGLVLARRPYGQPFEMRFTGKLLFASNSLPNIDDQDGIWRRLDILQFDAVPEHPDPDLLRKLKDELPGILNWCLDGFAALSADNEWRMPQSVVDTIAEYKSETDHIARFAEDELEYNEQGGPLEIQTADLYARYSSWMQARGLRALGLAPPLYKQFRQVGLEPGKFTVKGAQKRGWVGARLRAEEF